MANTALNRTSQALLTNKSGGALTYGDVVVLDNTNDNGFTTTTTGGLSTRGLGVILEPNGIANNASGMVAIDGWCPQINLNTAATVGQFIKTHTVAGQGTPHASPQVEGDFAVALTASATPAAMLFGSPNGPGGGGGTPGGSNTQVQYNNSSAFGGITGATTDGTTLTLVAPVLGTPASGVGTNLTGIPFTTGLINIPAICEGRLTTETGVPLSTADRTAQGTIYWTPSTSSGIATTTGSIALYNGTNVVLKQITELSLALTVSSGSNYDVFVDYNSGTPQLVLSAAWTNDTTRADALGVQNGIIVKSGTSAYRWVGTIRGSGANVTADAAATRYVWNAYNQLPRFMKVIDTTNTWTWNSATWHQANASAANQVAYVSGSAATLVKAEVLGCSNGQSGVAGAVGIGIDATNANSAILLNEMNQGVNSGNPLGRAAYRGYPGLGYHFVAWIEFARAGTITMQGDNGLADEQTGLLGEILG